MECNGSKNPGPDGFNIEFFKRCWGIVREDVMRVMREFHSNGKLVRGSNSSFIVLIPKKEGVCGINQMRPVSLIGSVYKIIAKVLACRMKGVIGKLIGEAQSAFIKGRNILDGVVVLNEVMDEARSRKKGWIKVDFAKAYDSIDCDYLIEMMGRMKFPKKWLRWISTCIKTASANVLVNGSPSGEFELGRDIRQGDPLSLFLFLVAAEGLNLMTKRAIGEGLLKPVVVGKDKVEISLIQYADDTLFVVEGSLENAVVLKRVLKLFEMVSGLKVNFEKSSVFGLNIEEGLLMGIAEELGCRVGARAIPYLGVKVGGRVNRKDAWVEVIEKIKKKLSGWNAKYISMGGRSTLVKATLSAIPLYWMSIFPLPKVVERMIITLQCNYLWGGKEDDKKIVWLKWEEICKPFMEGGLGIKNLGAFNKALIGKRTWRFLGERERGAVEESG